MTKHLPVYETRTIPPSLSAVHVFKSVSHHETNMVHIFHKKSPIFAVHVLYMFCFDLHFRTIIRHLQTKGYKHLWLIRMDFHFPCRILLQKRTILNFSITYDSICFKHTLWQIIFELSCRNQVNTKGATSTIGSITDGYLTICFSNCRAVSMYLSTRKLSIFFTFWQTDLFQQKSLLCYIVSRCFYAVP